MLRHLIAATAAVCIACTATFAAASDYARQKVVYHINVSDESALKGALANIQNHIDAVGKENLDLKVVMHGPGVDLLKIARSNVEFESAVSNLKIQDVEFKVCNNTLKRRRIDYRKDLYDVQDADIVPSGVAEIAKLQGEGYAYIKP